MTSLNYLTDIFSISSIGGIDDKVYDAFIGGKPKVGFTCSYLKSGALLFFGFCLILAKLTHIAKACAIVSYVSTGALRFRIPSWRCILSQLLTELKVPNGKSYHGRCRRRLDSISIFMIKFSLGLLLGLSIESFSTGSQARKSRETPSLISLVPSDGTIRRPSY